MFYCIDANKLNLIYVLSYNVFYYKNIVAKMDKSYTIYQTLLTTIVSYSYKLYNSVI